MEKVGFKHIYKVASTLLVLWFFIHFSCKPIDDNSADIANSDSILVESMVKNGVLLIEGNPDSSCVLFKLAIDYYDSYLKKTGSEAKVPLWLKRQAAFAHRGVGVYYTNGGNFQKALDELEVAINIVQGYKELNPDRFAKDFVLILNSKGVAQKKMGMYKEALETYQAAQSIASSSGDQESVAVFYTNTGNIYQELGDIEKAYEYINRALELHRENNNSKGVVISSLTLANILNSTGRFEEARPFYHKALKYCIQNNLYSNVGLIYSNLGVLEKRLGNFDVASQHFVSAIDNLSKVGNRQGLALVYGNLADLALATGKYTEAIEFASKQLNEAIQTDALVNQRYAYKHLSKAYAKLGNYKDAFDNHQRYTLINDSIMSIDKQKEISRLEALFQDEKKTEEIKYLESRSQLLANKNKLKSTMIVFLLVLLFISIILGATWIKNSKLKANQKQLILEQKLLRSQMNPHFLFNSLSAIQNIILQANKKEASTLLANFANFIRFILDSSRENLVPLNKEIEAINLFLSLQKVRSPNLFTHSFTLDLADDSSEILVPPLIIQPFVENAVIHGFTKGSTSGILSIQVSQEGKYLLCRVKDNGVGMSQYTSKKEGTHKSVATQITNERLSLLSKRYSCSASLVYEKLDENETGTSVLLKLPLLFTDAN